MKKLVTIDFETFWESKGYSLSKMGPVEYIRDKRFNVQMVGANRGGETQVFTDPALVEGFVKKLDDPDTVVIGHNLAGFDALILSEHFGVRPKHLWDTIAMANWTGVGRMGSRSHAAVTEFFGNGTKKAGTVVSDGKRWPDQFSEEEREFFTEYCRDDVSQCVANFARMLPYMTADALLFMSITARMGTEPAFVLDADMLREYIAGIDGDVAAARQSLLDTFHYTDEESFLKAIRSPHDFAFMLRRLGVEPPKKVSESKTKTMRAQFERDLASIREWETDPATKAEAEQAILAQMDKCLPVMNYAFSKQDLDFLALREHADPRVRELVNARLELNSSVNRSRAERLLCYAEHGKPIPITLAAFNAHTGRYTAGAADEAESSDRLQFQNLSKRDPAKAALRKAIKAPAGCSVVACDSSQVEARCLAWVAGETELVAQFAQGRDPYSELAETIFGVPSAEIKAGAKGGDKRLKTYRNVGKTCILSAGYGVGAQKFADTLLRSGAKLDDDVAKHNELAFHAHDVYRRANPNIVAFWRACGTVLDYMLAGQTVQFGGPKGNLFVAGPMPICGGVIVPSILLPSGYILRYPNLRRELVDGKNQIVYDRYKNRAMEPTRIYGGALTENIIQAFAFQILMWQACRMYEAGISIKCNIHDSFATVVPAEHAESTAQKMLSIMKTTPPWAEGLPIDAEAEVGSDFTVC